MAEQNLGLPQVNSGLRSGEFQFSGFFCPGAWTWPWQRQEGQLPRFFLLGQGAVIAEIWRSPVLRARPPPCPPRWLVNPTVPPRRPALLARWAAGNPSLLCLCETIRKASGLGAWVAKSFPLARPYHGLRILQAKFSLAQREGGRVGGGKERGPQEPQTKLPSLGPWRTSAGAGRGSHKLCGLRFGKAAGMMQLVLLSCTMSTISSNPTALLVPPLNRGGN